MKSRTSRLFWQIFSAFFVIALLVSSGFAESDPDPESPTPVLISQPDSTRALAVGADAWRGSLPKPSDRAFSYGEGSRIKLFVTNIDLMDGEAANAFRVYIQDVKGREYRLPVEDLRQVKGYGWIYALTVRLEDEIRFWEDAPTTGDVLVRVSWRGLTSNRVRLGLGETGGKIQDDAGAVPTPAPLTPPNSEAQTSDFVGYRWSGDRIRFLEQATFGPTQALDDRIRRIGLRTWLAEQFEMPYPSAANPYPNFDLKPINPTTDCNGTSGDNDPVDPDPLCFRNHYSMYPVQNWFYKEAFYGEPQLKHRVSWALSQIWVISGVDTQQSSHMLAYHKLLSKSAFGNWKTLMTDMTLNPGMGNYLDMARSTRLSPNENYAREVLQLFNIGLFMLNQDGTLQLDGQGNPIPTYDQNTVNNFTKVFTGWSFCQSNNPAICPSWISGTINYKDPMLLAGNNHDLTAKTLLSYPGVTNQNIAACTGCTGTAITTYANNSLTQAIENIYNHPNVAPFASKLLIQQLVTSDPTPAYVGRVAAVFNANRSSPNQMREVIRAILLDPEARGNIKTEPRYGKLREPVQLFTNLARHFDVKSADRTVLSDGVVNTEVAALGQNTFNAPTVFNYYSPDYIVPGTTLLAPEFGIYTTGTSIARINLGNLLVFSRININAGRAVIVGTSLSMAEMQALAAADTSGNQLLDALNNKMMHGAMSAEMRNTIRTAVLAVPAANTLLRAQTAVYLIATSSQYQVQR